MTYFERIVQTAGAASLAALLLAVPALAAPPQTLTVGLSGDFPALDPSKDTSPLGTNYRINVFDALTEIKRDGSVNPRLAESWSYSPDLLEWTFKLRKGVKFHDGGDLTASDVVFTVEKVLADNTTPLRQFLKIVKTVEKIDDYTIKFTLVQPYAIFNRQISYTYIMSKAYFDKAGPDAYAKKPIGTGPYKLVEWVKDDRLVLEANESYWRGAPAIKKGVFRPIPAEASRATALLSGEVDLVAELPPSLMAQLKASPELTVETAPGFRVNYLTFNVNKPPLDNPLIREAVDKAIDRDSIANKLLRGVGKSTGIMVPPSNVGYDPSFKPTAYDPEAAKKLVKESGYKGEVIPLQYPNNNFVMANEVAQAIAGYMTAAGLKVELKPMEFTAFFPLWLQAKFDGISFFAFGSSQYHAETVLQTLYEQGSHAYKVDPASDVLVKRQRTEVDLPTQQKTISEIFAQSSKNRYYLPLYDQLQIFGIKKTISYKPFPDGVVRLYDFK